MRLKQICNHPAQVAGTNDYAADRSGKFRRLAEIAEEIASRQEKVLVFTQFREIADPLAEFLATLFGRSGLVLHGGTSVKKRKEFVDQFQREDGPPFFVLSLKAGGTGLNLTAASHVIHFDRWWNPAIENQATDRAFRIGQKKNVLVHKFICRGTVEERIDEMIARKRQVAGEAIGGEDSGEALLTEMDNDTLLAVREAGFATGDRRLMQTRGRQETPMGMVLLRITSLTFPWHNGAPRPRGKSPNGSRKGKRSPPSDRGPNHRLDLLGQGVVHEPGELQRLCEPPAARADLRSQRFGRAFEDRQGADRSPRERVGTVRDPDRHRRAAEARTGRR